MPCIVHHTGATGSLMHRFHIRSTTAVVLLSFSLLVTGCTTTRTIPVSQVTAAESARVKPGDKVIVTLRSGETRTFRVTAVESGALVGKDVRIAFADIEKLQNRKVSYLKTGGAVLGVLVVAAGLWIRAIIESEEGAD